MLVSRVSSHIERSRPQDVPGSWSGPPLRTRGLRQREDQTSTSLTSLPALKSGGRPSFPWKTMEGLLSLTTQRRKHLQNHEFGEITILFVEDIKGPR